MEWYLNRVADADRRATILDMYVRGIAINGLADLPRFSVTGLGRQVTVRGPGAAAAAVGDGLSLGFAALSKPALQQLLVRWGLTSPGEEADIEADPLPTQATWTDTSIASGLCADRQKRKISVRIDLELDPPLCADLRALASRDPRVGIGIGESPTPTVSIEVSAYFGASWDVLSLSIQAVLLGNERFSGAATERPKWLTRLLIELGKRFVSHDEATHHGARAMSAMTSRSAADYERFRDWQACLHGELGLVRPVPSANETVMLLAHNRPIHRFGPLAQRRVHMATSAFLCGADIMWMGEHDDWASRFVEGDGTALEQLWTVSENGDVDPGAQPQPRTVLSFGSTEE